MRGRIDALNFKRRAVLLPRGAAGLDKADSVGAGGFELRVQIRVTGKVAPAFVALRGDSFANAAFGGRSRGWRGGGGRRWRGGGLLGAGLVGVLHDVVTLSGIFRIAIRMRLTMGS